MNDRNCRRLVLEDFAPRLALGVGVVLLLSVIIAVVGAAENALRNKVYDSQGFEPQPFVDGTPLLGTDGWSTAIPPFLNPIAATITNAASSNGRQSVEVWGGDLFGSDGITAPYDAVGSYRRPVNYEVSLLRPTVVVEADLLLETDQPGTVDDFFTLTIAARSGDSETLGEVGLSSSGSAVAYDFDAPPGALPAFTAPIDFNEWHHVTIMMDFTGEKANVAYFVDGVLIGAMPTESTSRTLSRGSMVVYALPDGDGNARANYTARLDNFRISVQRPVGGD